MQPRRIPCDDAPSDAPDARLIAQAQVDPAAFGAIYGRYADAVYWYCVRRTGDPWTAEDTTAQIFTQAFSALGRFDPAAGSFRSWLFRIAHNVTVDHARRRRPHGPIAAVAELLDPRPTPEEALIADEDERRLRHALGRLSADQRAVVELRLAGLTGAEVAATLGRSVSWVHTTYFRAVARLRALLADPSNEEPSHARP